MRFRKKTLVSDDFPASESSPARTEEEKRGWSWRGSHWSWSLGVEEEGEYGVRDLFCCSRWSFTSSLIGCVKSKLNFILYCASAITPALVQNLLKGEELKKAREISSVWETETTSETWRRERMETGNLGLGLDWVQSYFGIPQCSLYSS